MIIVCLIASWNRIAIFHRFSFGGIIYWPQIVLNAILSTLVAI